MQNLALNYENIPISFQNPVPTKFLAQSHMLQPHAHYIKGKMERQNSSHSKIKMKMISLFPYIFAKYFLRVTRLKLVKSVSLQVKDILLISSKTSRLLKQKLYSS